MGELTALLRSPSWIKDGDNGRTGREREKWVTVGEGKDRGRGGGLTRFTINQCWQVCDMFYIIVAAAGGGECTNSLAHIMQELDSKHEFILWKFSD